MTTNRKRDIADFVRWQKSFRARTIDPISQVDWLSVMLALAGVASVVLGLVL